MDVRFDHLGFVHLLWCLPVMVGLCVLSWSRRRSALGRFASASLSAFLMPNVSRSRPFTKAGLLLLALVGVIAGLTGPRWGTRWEEVPPKGIDIFVLLDVSRSMLAEDLTPNRIERAKLYVQDLVHKLPGDRIGLISFSGKAAVTCPLTTNYGWFLMALDQADLYSSSLGGSSLGDAIRLAADSFLDRATDHKAIIVFSDGEDQESYPVDAARAVYQEKGVRVYTVGLGDSNTGSRIPVEKDGQRVYLTYDGQEVWSKMNAGLMQETALAGGGAYVPAGTQSVDMGEIYETRLAAITQREFEESGKVQRYIPRFQWFAGLGMLSLLIETILSEARAAALNQNRGSSLA